MSELTEYQISQLQVLYEIDPDARKIFDLMASGNVGQNASIDDLQRATGIDRKKVIQFLQQMQALGVAAISESA